MLKHQGNSLLSRFGLVVRSHRPAARVQRVNLAVTVQCVNCLTALVKEKQARGAGQISSI